MPFFDDLRPTSPRPLRHSDRALYALDAVAADRRLLTDSQALARAARAALGAHGGQVLGEAVASLPNQAVDVVLVLGGAHLTLHAWPQEGLVAADLFCCSALDGRAVIERLGRELTLVRSSLRRLRRLPPP